MQSQNNAPGEKFFLRGSLSRRSPPPPPLTRVLKEARPPLVLPLRSQHLDYPLVFSRLLQFMNIIIKSGDILRVLAGDAFTRINSCIRGLKALCKGLSITLQLKIRIIQVILSKEVYSNKCLSYQGLQLSPVEYLVFLICFYTLLNIYFIYIYIYNNFPLYYLLL